MAFFVLTCTLWWIESFLTFSFLYYYYYFVSCCLVVLFDSFSLYYEEMWTEQADDMVFAAPERGIENIPNI